MEEALVSTVQGDGAPAAGTGDGAPAAGTGDGTPAAGTGDGAPAAGTGDGTPATGTGDGAPAAGTGDGAPATGTGDGSGFVQEIIAAIGELGNTLAGAGDSGEPAETQTPATEQGGAGEAPPVWFVEYEASSGTDLTPVVELLEATDESLIQVNNNLLQLQANVNFVFLAVCVLIGAVIGCGVARVLHDLWRS